MDGQRPTGSRGPDPRGTLARVDAVRELPPSRDAVQTVSPDLNPILKTAAVAGLGYGAARLLGPSRLASYVSRLGRGAAAVRSGLAPLRGLAEEITSGKASLASVANRWRAGSHLYSEPDIVEELRQIQTTFRGYDLEHFMGATAGPEGSVLDIHRKFLAGRYGSARAPRGLRYLTVEDVLKDTRLSSRFSCDTISTLKRFSKMGMVTGDMRLSQSSRFSFFRDGKGRVLDTNWASPQRLFKSFYEAGHNFQIPVLGVSPTDLALGPLYPFIMGPTKHSTIGSGITLPSGIKTARGMSFSLGSNIYSQMGGSAAFEHAASGVTVLDVSHPGTQFYARAAASWMGKSADEMDRIVSATIPARNVSPKTYWWRRLQKDVLGFGPSYQTEQSVPQHLFRSLVRANKEMTWVPHDFVGADVAMRRGGIRGYARGMLRSIRFQAGYTGDDLDMAMREATINPKGTWESLSNFEKTMANLGESRYGEFYEVPPGPGSRGVIFGGPPHPRRPMQGFTPLPPGISAPAGARGFPARSIPATGVVIPGSGRNVSRTVMEPGALPPMLALDFETLGRTSWGTSRPYEVGLVPLGEGFEPKGKAFGAFLRRSAAETGSKEAQEAFDAIKVQGEARRAILEKIHSADPEDEVRKRMVAFLDQHIPRGRKGIIVGHNTEFDLPILRKMLGDELFGRYFSGQVVDSLVLSRKWKSRLPGGYDVYGGLESMAAHLGVGGKAGAFHTAVYDAETSARIAGRLHPQYGAALPRDVFRRQSVLKTAEATGGDMLNLFMHHATERLNTLVGATTGVGIRPVSGKYGWVGNLAKIYGMFAIGKMGVEYARYADYMAGQALSVLPGVDDTRPSQYAVGAYTKAMVARQWVRRITGIQPAAEYMEGLMPGSMSSPLSWAARTVLPGLTGALKGRTALGAAASFLVGGADIEQHPNDLAAVYRGDKMVPQRAGRWWSVGMSPWEGGKVQYYRPHWAARYQKNWEYTDTLYGSQREYFSYASDVPTPSNMFGLLPLVRPDYYSEKHYYNRPYPYSESGVPMHVGEETPPLPAKQSANMMQMGLTPQPGAYEVGLNPASLGSRLRQSTQYVTELGGLYKWFAEQIPGYDSLFGKQREHDMYRATASTITSASRRFYDENLGGLVGSTELLRRFLNPDRGRQGINYIPNMMPDWLPGIRAANKSDRYYFNDFQTGDPYAKIPGGEYRLPGKALESVRPLHSGIPGVYDAMDRYLILADVAPWSETFKQYHAIVSGWASSGALDASWKQRFDDTEQQVESVLIPQFQPRIFSGVRSGTLNELAKVNKYSGPERVLGAGWEYLTHDIVPAVGRAIPVVGSYVDRKLIGRRSAYEKYMEDTLYGTDFQDWERPYSSFIQTRARNLIASSPPVAALGGAAFGMFFGATPAGLIAGGLGAVGFGAASTVRMAATGRMRGGWIPGGEAEASSEEQYFDALSFMRFRKMQSLAESKNLPTLAHQYSFAAARTSVGMDYSMPTKMFLEAARYRVGSSVKDYMWSFAQAPQQSRERIMEILPPMARPLMSSLWARQGDTRYDMSPGYNPDQEAASIVASRGMPPADWPGWQADIPMDVIKMRTLDSVHGQAYDMHRHNLWESDRRYANRAFPSLTPAY